MDANAKPGVVEEIVDNSGGVEETDALVADVIKEVEQEWEDEAVDALPDGESDADNAEPAADNGDEAGAGEGEEEPAEPDGEADEADRGTERLVKREVELRLKEEAVAKQLAEIETVRSENQQLKQHLADLEAKIPHDFIDDLRANPWETLESVGYDPEHVVRVVLAQKLQKQGKEVPKELREEIRAAEYEYKFKKQEQKLQQIEQSRKAAEFVAKVETEARQYVRAMDALKPEFSKDAPTVAKVAKADPERVYAEIMDEISRDANARSREPGAQLISYAEAARRVEKRWAAMKKLFGGPETASTPADETKSTSAATGASNAGKTGKKVVKPLTPPKAKSWEEIEKEGLEAGLAEYKRAELASRAKRIA